MSRKPFLTCTAPPFSHEVNSLILRKQMSNKLNHQIRNGYNLRTYFSPGSVSSAMKVTLTHKLKFTLQKASSSTKL